MKCYVPSTEDSIRIDSDFEGGTLDRSVRLGENYYALELRPDCLYHFHFRIRGCKGKRLVFQFRCRNCIAPLNDMDEGLECWQSPGRSISGLVNGLRDERLERWYGPQKTVSPLVTYDSKTYHPVEHICKDTSGVRGVYVFEHTFTEGEAFVSSNLPYLYSTLLTYLDSIRDKEGVTISSIGESRNGLSQFMVTIQKNPLAKKAAVIITRESAIESATSWAAEGILNSILSDDACVQAFLSKHILCLIPMVSVDGVVAGSIHTAGYGFAPFRYQHEPIPQELGNIRSLLRQLKERGLEVVLAGKLHSGWSMEPQYPMHFTATNAALIRALLDNQTDYWKVDIPDRKIDQLVFSNFTVKPTGSILTNQELLSIPPEGSFERAALDDTGCQAIFNCHVQGKTSEDMRFCGRDLQKALMRFLQSNQ